MVCTLKVLIHVWEFLKYATFTFYNCWGTTFNGGIMNLQWWFFYIPDQKIFNKVQTIPWIQPAAQGAQAHLTGIRKSQQMHATASFLHHLVCFGKLYIVAIDELSNTFFAMHEDAWHWNLFPRNPPNTNLHSENDHLHLQLLAQSFIPKSYD